MTLPRDNRRVPRTEPATVLVLRVWCEGDGPNHLRARIMYTPEASSPITRAVAGTVDDVCGVVREWIVSHVAGGGANPVTRR